MRISFLTPRLPPAVCGVGDHTACLARALCEQRVEVGFIALEPLQRGDVPRSGPVEHWSGSPRSLIQCVARQQPDWLWIQLSSYGYSRWGAPFRLARAVARLRRDMPNLHVAVCAHETHCQPGQLGAKGPILSPWQRHTVGAVVRQADLVFTSIARYVNQIQHSYRIPASKIVRLPIGSNIPLCELDAAGRKQVRTSLGVPLHGLVAVTFGSFPNQLRALQACWPAVARGLDQGVICGVICVGGSGSAVPIGFAQWAGRVPRGPHFVVLGNQPDQRVAEILACADFAFSSHPRAQLGKSGAFAAAALVGVPTIAAPSPWNEPLDPQDPPAIDIEHWQRLQADEAAIGNFQQAVRAYALTELAWESLAGRALRALQNCEFRSRPIDSGRAGIAGGGLQEHEPSTDTAKSRV